MKIIDTSGLQCPAPLIATKRALKEYGDHDSFRIITDNNVSFSNITRFLSDNNVEFSHKESEGKWIIEINSRNSGSLNHEPEDYCNIDIPHLSKGKFIIVFNSSVMGEGSDDLGRLLMVNFIKALKDLDNLPDKIVFYNSGVFLGADDSQVSGYLKELEKMGVILLFCATCVQYYLLEEKIKCGTFSNMFEIAQAMASASGIIRP